MNPTMPSPVFGHRLRAIENFPLDVVVCLRDKLSVSTAEAFLAVAKTSGGAALAEHLGIDEGKLYELLTLAKSVLTEEEIQQALSDVDTTYFQTGVDPVG